MDSGSNDRMHQQQGVGGARRGSENKKGGAPSGWRVRERRRERF